MFQVCKRFTVLLHILSHLSTFEEHIARHVQGLIASTIRGAPAGKSITIDGRYEAYIATPAPEKIHEDITILYVPDIFGIWQNSKLVADQFAANGYLCLLVDPFNGDKLPDPLPADFDIMNWLVPHTKDSVDPIALAGIRTLKEEYGAKKVGGVGYCFGAKVSTNTATDADPVSREFPSC